MLGPPGEHPTPRLDLDRVREEHNERRQGDPPGARGERHVQRAEFAPVLDDRAPDHPGHDARDGELQGPPEPFTHSRHGGAAPRPRCTGPRSAARRRRGRSAVAGRPRPPPPVAATRGPRRVLQWPGRLRDDVGHAPAVPRGDHGHAQEQRLRGHEAQSLPHCGKHEHVGVTDGVGNTLGRNLAEEADLARDPELGDAALEPRPCGAVAHDRERRRSATGAELGQGVEQQVNPLLRREPADGDDPPATSAGPRKPLGVDRHRLDQDPARLELHRPRRAHGEIRRHGGHCGGAVQHAPPDEPRRPRTLEQGDIGAVQRHHVRAAGEPGADAGRDPPMRVDDVEPLVAPQPGEDSRLPLHQRGGPEQARGRSRGRDHGAPVCERLPARGGVADSGDGRLVAQLLAPNPCVGRCHDVHAVAARLEREHQPLDERARHVAIPAGIGVGQAGDVQVLTNRYTIDRASMATIRIGGCR